MPKGQYKYLIWNSSWYKKNINPAQDWTAPSTTDSELLVKAEQPKKSNNSKLQNIFSWWRLGR